MHRSRRQADYRIYGGRDFLKPGKNLSKYLEEDHKNTESVVNRRYGGDHLRNRRFEIMRELTGQMQSKK